MPKNTAMRLRPKISIVRDPKVRAQVWERDKGVCCDCHRFHADWQCEHQIPLWQGGKDELENAVTRCPKCHKPKTAREAGQRAKADRIRERHEAMKKRMEVR